MYPTQSQTLFIADSWHSLDHANDTTLLLARQALEHGFECYWATTKDIYLEDDQLWARTSLIKPDISGLHPSTQTLPLTQYHSIHWRADPPVTLETTRLWSLLATLLPPHKMHNSALSLLKWNEKFCTHHFRGWALPTLVANAPEPQQHFIKSTLTKGKRVIVKPAADAASRGITVLPENLDEALRAFAELQPQLGPWPLLQEFDTRIAQGETRIFTLDGHIRGTLKKIPSPHHTIVTWNDADHKPQVSITTPTDVQQERALKVAHTLLKDGARFLTVDFLDDSLLEINLTSPGLVQKLEPEQRQTLLKQYWDPQNNL